MFVYLCVCVRVCAQYRITFQTIITKTKQFTLDYSQCMLGNLARQFQPSILCVVAPKAPSQHFVTGKQSEKKNRTEEICESVYPKQTFLESSGPEMYLETH